MSPDQISLQTTPVYLFNAGKLMSQGTGFYWVREDKHEGKSTSALFLVTNYHVLTGSAPGEKKPPLGDAIRFQFHASTDNPGSVISRDYPLYSKSGRPVFVTSSTVPDADLAVIPLPCKLYRDAYVCCLSADWIRARLKVRPTSTVTLVGYPYGLFDATNQLPIYKTGSVASEPDYDFNGKPVFLVDVSAFPGMSGSPVFAVSYGTYEMDEGTTTVGSVRRFLGVYASMQMLEEKRYLEQLTSGVQLGVRHSESLELGYVWKANLVADTINGIDIERYVEEVLSDT